MSIQNKLIAVRASIIACETQFARTPGSVRLVAVSKQQSVAAIQHVAAAGQHDFGENYVQEAVPKIIALREQHPALCWHFIGRLQSNKLALIAEHFSWVHSLTTLRHAQLLNNLRPANLPPLNVCLQINIEGMLDKIGLLPAQLATLARAVAQLPRLKLRGLMVMPVVATEFAQQCVPFRVTRNLLTTLQYEQPTLDTMSMGMSGDYVAAIAEGSTLLRIGTMIFDNRSYPKIGC